MLGTWFVFRRCVGYKQVNTFSVFLPLTLATNGLLVPLSQQLNEQITAFQITKFNDYWLGLALMYASMPLGIVLANAFKRKSQLSDVELQDIDVVGNHRRVGIYLLIIFLISLLSIVQIYASGLSFDLYSYVTLKMDYATYEAHRYSFADATSGLPYYLYNKLPYGLAPLGIIMVWNARGSKGWQKVAFLGVLAFAILQTSHKMPLIVLAACLVLSRALIRWRFRLSKPVIWSGVAVLLVTVFVVIPLFYFMQGEQQYTSALFWSIERVFLEPTRILQLHFETYPSIHPFLHGMSTRTIASVFGVKNYIPPSLYIPNEVLGIENTSFPALFIGEAWADFGYFGVVAISIIVGFLLQIYNVWFFNQRRPRLEEAALFISIILSTIHLQASNFFTTLLTYGMFSSFLIYRWILRGAVPPSHSVKGSAALWAGAAPPSNA